MLFQAYNIEGQKYEKCSEAPVGICGPNAKCYENGKEGDFCKCDSLSFFRPPNCQDNLCNIDSDCKSTEYCRSFNCIHGCREGRCGQGEFCSLGTRLCTKGCNEDSLCKDGEYCELKTNLCSVGCRRDDECKDDEFCSEESHKCTKVCEIYSCGPNSICTGKNHLKYCSCNDGYVAKKGEGCLESKEFENKNTSCGASCAVEDRCYKKDNRVFCTCQFDKSKDPLVTCFDYFKPTTSTTHRHTVKPTSDQMISLACVQGCVLG